MEGSPDHPGQPGDSPDHSQTSGRASWTSKRASRPHPHIREASRTSGRAAHNSQTFGKVSRPLPDNWEGLTHIREGHPTTAGHLEGPTTPQGHLGGSPHNSWTSGRAFRPLPDIQEGFPTSSGHPGVLSDHSRTSRRVFRPLLHNRTFGRATRPLLDIQEGLPDIGKGLLTTPAHQGGPPAHPRVIPDIRDNSQHSRKSGSVSRSLLDNREIIPDIRECYPGHSGVLSDHSQTSGGHPTTHPSVSRPL